MAYKYLNDNGLKAYTKKVKGALKDLHTPIAISTENTTESKAQNVKNIADFVAKAKAAGIADVNGMAVTCLISGGNENSYSGVGYIYICGNISVQGIVIKDDFIDNVCFTVDSDGRYAVKGLIVSDDENSLVTSLMLDKGARNPIILTPVTTEVDEATYQKLLTDDVDVVYKDNENTLFYVFDVDKNLSVNDIEIRFVNTLGSIDTTDPSDYYFGVVSVEISKNAPHTVTSTSGTYTLQDVINANGLLHKSTLSPVLREIDLTGTDADRKAKLDKFEADWKALTGASDLTGARFAGNVQGEDYTGIFTWSIGNAGYVALVDGGERSYSMKVYLNHTNGSLTITPLFSHLEPVEIFTDNSAASNQKNLDNLKAYKAKLEQLGVDTSKSFQVPFQQGGGEEIGVLYYSTAEGPEYYIGISFSTNNVWTAQKVMIDHTGSYNLYLLAFNNLVETIGTIAQAVKAFGAIELKASDNAANKAALTAYLKILTDADVSITNGYSVPVRITGNAQEYHGMLNIGTGALLSGIVTDVNENHHYPFNVSTADGAITFDANNYFLEKTSNEVTEMLDAIKYSYTPVPLTATTLSNKAQLEVFLSKVPTAQVMHVTYKDVYAGTLHKINGSWYGVLVGESNTLAGQLSIKLQADGTIVEGTA